MDINNDPVFAKSTVRTNLKFHYQSIMDQLHRRLGDLNSQEYIIENWWSLNSATATFMNEAAWREYMNIDVEWNSAIYEGQRIENSGEDPGATNDNLYFALGRLDEKRKIFINSQHKWISEYFLQAYPSSDGNINKLEVSIFPLFLVENLSMEILALWETHTWELLFLQTSFGILEGVDRLDKVPIWRELRSSCLRRLHVSSQMCSERTQHLDNRLHDHMQKAWKLFTQRYEGEPRSLLKMSQRDVNGLIHDLNELKFWDDTITKSISYTVRDLITKAFSVHYPAENSVLSREMWKRVRTEKRNAENRVRKSLEVSCEPITSSSSILNLGTWTHRMWLCPDSIWEQTELAFSNSVNGLENRILEARRLISTLPCLENVILIYIKSLDIYSPEIVVDLLKAICAMPSVTSIVVDNSLIPPMIRDKWNRMGLPDEIAKCLSENKRLLSVSFDPLPDVERFMRNIVQKNWHCLSEETDRTFMRMLGIKGSGLSRGKLINDARIDISFIGPESSNLSLRITFPPFHDCQTVIPGLEKTSYSSNILSPFAIQMHMNDYLKIIEFESHSSSVVPAVYHVDLHCGEIETHINELYFRPGERNNLTLIITVEAGRTCNLADVELLKDGNPWKPLSEWCTSQHGEFET
ncbi:hypothetical protein BDQ17DRAFT_190708 [Cyathus striatus]|nr:hypothetical protein BDQ17DRAFT_190708 [Cyathus striatus]